MISTIEKIIKKYTEEILKCKSPKSGEQCERCFKTPERFIIHERRERSFRYIVENFVYKITSLLLQLKCPLCLQTFTNYPSFAVPYKRYIKDDIIRLASEYNKEDQSYRELAKHNNMLIGYQEHDDNSIDERILNHSSIWHWVGTLGNMKELTNAAYSQIKQKSTYSKIDSEFPPINLCKYRSEERKLILQNVRKLFGVCMEFEKAFNGSFFQRFATAIYFR